MYSDCKHYLESNLSGQYLSPWRLTWTGGYSRNEAQIIVLWSIRCFYILGSNRSGCLGRDAAWSIKGLMLPLNTVLQMMQETHIWRTPIVLNYHSEVLTSVNYHWAVPNVCGISLTESSSSSSNSSCTNLRSSSAISMTSIAFPYI